MVQSQKFNTLECYGFGPNVMKKSKVCPRCGQMVRAKTRTCPECRAWLSDETLFDRYKQLHPHCPGCDTVLAADSRYCPNCGRMIHYEGSNQVSDIEVTELSAQCDKKFIRREEK